MVVVEESMMVSSHMSDRGRRSSEKIAIGYICLRIEM
jgi:hypothetical protein